RAGRDDGRSWRARGRHGWDPATGNGTGCRGRQAPPIRYYPSPRRQERRSRRGTDGRSRLGREHRTYRSVWKLDRLQDRQSADSTANGWLGTARAQAQTAARRGTVRAAPYTPILWPSCPTLTDWHGSAQQLHAPRASPNSAPAPT